VGDDLRVERIEEMGSYSPIVILSVEGTLEGREKKRSRGPRGKHLGG